MKNATQKITPLAARDGSPTSAAHPEAIVDRAIESLRVELDPIVSLDDGRVVAHEARLRCDEPLLNGAAGLLRVASTLGRRRDVGRRARTLVALAGGQTKVPYVLFSVDGTDLLDGELYAPDSPLARAADRGVLLLDEDIPLDDLLDLHGRIVDMRRQGFSVAIDGAGLAANRLAACAVIAPDFVRLDPTLVQRIHRAAPHRLLLRGLCNMFARLGARVIAPGVESLVERDILAALGCELGQGALFKAGAARPAGRSA